MSKSIILELENINLIINRKRILEEINLSLTRGKSYALMGPNGSGKSSLAKVIMGYPDYQPQNGGKIIFQDQDITNLSMDKRAKLGIFLSSQAPPEFDGIKVTALLQTASAPKRSRLQIRKEVEKLSQELQLEPTVVKKPLNQTASGGERKKLELLQAAILDPTLLILDEIDTGVDVDSLKTISRFIKNHFVKANKTLLLITHYQRILEHLTPDRVLVMKAGRITRSGDYSLAKLIDKKGYGWI